jgi:hypothetical protein
VAVIAAVLAVGCGVLATAQGQSSGGPPVRSYSDAELRLITRDQPDFAADISIWNDEDASARVRVGRILRHQRQYRIEPSTAVFGSSSTPDKTPTPGDVVWLYTVAESWTESSLLTLLPVNRTYARSATGSTLELMKAVFLAPYPLFIHAPEDSKTIRLDDGGVATVNGHRCRIIKIISRTREITLYAALDLRGLAIKGVLRSSCCESFNPSGLTFELDNITLGSDPALFKVPTRFREVGSIRLNVTPTLSSIDKSNEGQDEAGSGDTAPDPFLNNKAPVCESMTAIPKQVRAGDPVIVEVRTSDADGDVIYYTWHDIPGTVLSPIEHGAKRITLDTKALAPGRYRVVVFGDDGFSHSIECSTEFEVVAP